MDEDSVLIRLCFSIPSLLFSPIDGKHEKVSDYGSANFTNLVSTTTGPGNPFYAASEAGLPYQHSLKMDTFSFGVLPVEMCLRELPESRPECQEDQTQHVQCMASHGVAH